MASLVNAYQYREWLAAAYIRHGFTPQSGARFGFDRQPVRHDARERQLRRLVTIRLQAII